VSTKTELVRGYAEALFAIATAEGDLDKVENELFDFAKALEANADLREALTDPALPAERKKAVLADLLGGRATPHTLNALDFIVEQGRARELGEIVSALANVAAASRQSSLAEVRTAVDLSDTQREQIRKALSDASGRPVEIKVVVDPSIIGGVVARIGDEVFDGTVRSRLTEVGERLKGA